jgi:hypothetical protein
MAGDDDDGVAAFGKQSSLSLREARLSGMGNLPSVDAEVYAEELKVAGEDRPEPRQSAAVVQLSDNELLLFGGGSGYASCCCPSTVTTLSQCNARAGAPKQLNSLTYGY